MYTFVNTFIYSSFQIYMFQYSMECFKVHVCVHKRSFSVTTCPLFVSVSVVPRKVFSKRLRQCTFIELVYCPLEHFFEFVCIGFFQQHTKVFIN